MLPAMVVAGAIGGALWAAIPALLRTRFNANEILVSLMLVYIAQLAVSWLVHGPWKDPAGFNFPQTKMFADAALLPILIEGTRLNVGVRDRAGRAARAATCSCSGASSASRCASPASRPRPRATPASPRRGMIWIGLAARAARWPASPAWARSPARWASSPSTCRSGYGFAAIIVAFVGRLNPVGIFFASLLMALLYLGGEQAQQYLNLPSSISKVFQGMLLFFLLGADVFINYRAALVAAAAKGRAIDGTASSPRCSFATIVAGTPLIITALGELVTEKSGVLNLGAEGHDGRSARSPASPSRTTPAARGSARSPAWRPGARWRSIFAVLTLTLMANQVASGLALSIFGVGLSAFIGKPYESVTLPAVPPIRIPLLADIPVIGPALFDQQSLVYVSWAAVRRRRRGSSTAAARGLVLRAVGESPASAHSIGYPVIRIRYLATLFGGAMAGVGGAFLSVFYTPLWVEGMVAGRGWIALALVVFATWRPVRVLVGAYLFGGVMIAQFFVQGSGAQIDIPSQFLSSLPYWATIIVLVIISRNVKRSG